MCPVDLVDLRHDIVIEAYLKATKRVFQLPERRGAENHRSHEWTFHRPGKSHLRQIEIIVFGKLLIGVYRWPETRCDAVSYTHLTLPTTIEV